jgi:hypothetical protein
MATYYIDFAAGVNTNAGTSAGAPWKHCPGDSNATGTPSTTNLASGDVVIFKGGVAYEGQLRALWDGSVGAPIIYDGNTAGTFGTGRATISGATSFSATWTQCTSAADCRGNPLWPNIWYCTLPSGVEHPIQTLFMNGEMCYTAQSPNPTSRFYLDDFTTAYTVAPANITDTSLTDPAVFNNPSSTHYADAWVGVWLSNNTWAWKQITAYNPATGTVTLTDNGNNPYTDRNAYYTVVGHPDCIDVANEYSFAISENRCYLWPAGGVNPNGQQFSLAVKGRGIEGTGVQHITIRGFIWRGQWGLLSQGGTAIRFNESGNILVDDCIVRYNRSLSREWMIRLSSWTSGPIVYGKMQVHDCTVEECDGGAIAVLVSRDAEILRNTAQSLSRTAIYMAGCEDSIISQNSVLDVRGSHANGVSVYSACDNIIISRNLIRNAATLLTYEYSTNLYFLNNVLDGDGQEQLVREWGGCGGNVVWAGNTLVNSTATAMVGIGISPVVGATYVLRNNIIGRGGYVYPEPAGAVRSHNIYLDLAFWQNGGYGWSLGTGETENGDQTSLFADSAAGNWALKAGSAAINAGTDVSAYTGGALDFDGNARPSGGGWDLGAYEYGSGTTAAPLITLHPASQLVDQYDTATLEANASGVPTPTWQWYKGGVLMSGETSRTLTIYSVAASDAGTYTATATNSQGAATTNGAVLTVNTPIPTPPSSAASPLGNRSSRFAFAWGF